MDEYPLYRASGFGGQELFVVPSLGLVVVVTSDWLVSPAVSTRQYGAALDLLGTHILPSVRASSPTDRCSEGGGHGSVSGAK